MSELLELVDRVSKAESERDQLRLDLEQAQRTIQAQMEQLAGHNPALLERFRNATFEAREIFNSLYDKLQPGSELKERVTRFLEENGGM